MWGDGLDNGGYGDGIFGRLFRISGRPGGRYVFAPISKSLTCAQGRMGTFPNRISVCFNRFSFTSRERLGLAGHFRIWTGRALRIYPPQILEKIIRRDWLDRPSLFKFVSDFAVVDSIVSRAREVVHYEDGRFHSGNRFLISGAGNGLGVGGATKGERIHPNLSENSQSNYFFFSFKVIQCTYDGLAKIRRQRSNVLLHRRSSGTLSG